MLTITSEHISNLLLYAVFFVDCTAQNTSIGAVAFDVIIRGEIVAIEAVICPLLMTAIRHIHTPLIVGLTNGTRCVYRTKKQLRLH